MSETRECRACGLLVRLTPTGRLRAHDCPHGRVCLQSYSARRVGKQSHTCRTCRASRQLLLFPLELAPTPAADE